jgi:hypothetical protein
MKKKPLRIENIKEHTVRYTLELEGDTNSTPLAALQQLFQDLVDQPLLLRCGPMLPEVITIKYNGDLWTLIGTAEQQLDMTNLMFDNDSDGNETERSKNPYMGKLGL